MASKTLHRVAGPDPDVAPMLVRSAVTARRAPAWPPTSTTNRHSAGIANVGRKLTPPGNSPGVTGQFSLAVDRNLAAWPVNDGRILTLWRRAGSSADFSDRRNTD